MEQLLGPLPPQLQRSCQRRGGQLAPSSVPPLSVATTPSAFGASPSVQSILPRLASAGRSAISETGMAAPNGAASLMPANLPVQAWHESLSPLGQELAKVDSPAFQTCIVPIHVRQALAVTSEMVLSYIIVEFSDRSC